eukprot:SM000190S04850  [mRNA]  locus=s190:84684:86417:- [translate_table: standard]
MLGRDASNTGKHLLAGVLSALVSRTTLAPLERLKLEYVVRGAKGGVGATVGAILRAEGVGGFWRGNVVNLLRTAPFKSVNFYAFDVYRRQLRRWSDRADVNNVERLVAGAAAGITATLICFPMDTVRTRMVAHTGAASLGLVQCVRQIVGREGVLALYKGIVPALVSMAPGGAVFYGTYDLLKSRHLLSDEGRAISRRRKDHAQHVQADSSTDSDGSTDTQLRSASSCRQMELDPMRTLLYGAIAGACAETATYPLEVVRRQLQLQAGPQRLSMLAAFQSVIQSGGPAALYAGLFLSTVQVLPSAALSYFVYELAKANFNVQ